MKNFIPVAYILILSQLVHSCNREETTALEQQEDIEIDALGNSPGQPGSPSLKKGSSSLTSRFYYASDDMAMSIVTINEPDGQQREIPAFGNPITSIKQNALGDNQVLFYDYYAPQKIDSELNQYTILFYHGGGFQSGAANDVCTSYHLDEWLQMGFHGVIIGYRRGWFGNGSESPGAEAEITPLEGSLFQNAADMALTDAQEAWAHYNKNAIGHGRWFSGQSMSQTQFNHNQSQPKYIVMGNSAGGSLVSRTVHTHPYPSSDIQVAGAIVGFGTHQISEPVLETHKNVPTIVVGGMFDGLSPLYNNHLFYDSDMPYTKGVMNFYEELVEKNYAARILISAQKGHGWASFGKDSNSPVCDKSIPDFVKDPMISEITSMSRYFALSFFFSPHDSPNFQHFKFSKNAKHDTGPNFPTVDDEGLLYEQIGLNPSQKANVLNIDPSILGLDASQYIFVDGFNYGNDLQNGLGNLAVSHGFRYEPFQTEFEKAFENQNKPSDIRVKYNF